MIKNRIWLISISGLLLIILIYFVMAKRDVTILIGIGDSRYDSLNIEITLDDSLIFKQWVKNGLMVYEKISIETDYGDHLFSVKAISKSMSLDTSCFIMFNDNLWIQGFSDTIWGDGFLFDNIGLENYYFD